MVCTKCGEDKQPSEFSMGKDKHRRPCKACRNIQAREWVRVHHDEQWKYHRSYNLKSKYGISVEQYNKMLEAQAGVCYVCGGTNVNEQVLHVDHDHKTGVIRSLLCSNCNAALGLTHDDPALLRELADYVERYQVND